MKGDDGWSRSTSGSGGGISAFARTLRRRWSTERGRKSVGAVLLGAALAAVPCGLVRTAGATDVDALQVVQVTPKGATVEIVVAVPERLTGQPLPAEAFLFDAGQGPTVPPSVEPLGADRSAVAVVLDNRSVIAPADLLAAEGAAVELLRALEPGTPVAVVTTTGPTVVQVPTTDRSVASSSIGSVHIGGEGSLTDGVGSAVEALGGGHVAPVVVLFSAGDAEVQAGPLTASVNQAGALLTVFDDSGARTADLIPAIDQLAGSLTGRHLVTVPAWGRGPASLDLNIGGRSYQATVDLPAELEAPPASLSPPADDNSPTAGAPTASQPSVGSVAPAGSTAAPASEPAGSAGGRHRIWAVLLAAGLAMAAVGVVLLRRGSSSGAKSRGRAPASEPAPAMSGPVMSGPAMTAPAMSGAFDPPTAARAAAPPVHWTDLPTIDHLLAWSGRGVSTGRTWVVSPSQAALRARWSELLAAPVGEKRKLFVEGRGLHTVDAVIEDGLPGYPASVLPLIAENRSAPVPIRYARRSFDRQWLIPDRRVIDRPNVALWGLRLAPDQVFLTSTGPPLVAGGPALTATCLLPQFNHYNGARGRVWPLWLDAEGRDPNVGDGLLPLLSASLGLEVTGPDLFAYVMAVTGHAAFTERFEHELSGDALRLPLTAEGAVFTSAVALGHRVLWLHTLGEHRCVDHDHARSLEPLQSGGEEYPRLAAPIPHAATSRPETAHYESATHSLHVGEGIVEHVTPQVWSFEVGGMRVVEQWLAQRLPEAARRRQSPLDHLVPTGWEADWTTELLQLLHALTRLREVESTQRGLLDEVLDGPLISIGDLVRGSPSTAVGVPALAE